MKPKLPISVTALECAQRQTLRVSDYLLVLLLRGTAVLRRQEALPAGTLLFLSPYCPERLCLEPGCSVLYSLIDLGFLEDMIGLPRQTSLLLSGDDNVKEKLITYFDLCYNRENASRISVLGAGCDLLRALEPSITGLPAATQPDDTGGTRTARIIAYLEEHFREPLQLEDLSQRFGASRQHISTYLHRELGVSFHDYLQKLRLEESMRLLLTTDETITTISEESGFPNLRAFNTVFRREYGCTPREYRAEKAAETRRSFLVPNENLLSDVNQLLKPYRLVYNKSREILSATDTFSAAAPEPYEPVWRDILNIDNAADCLQSEVREAVSGIQRALGFRYVRLGNVFCDELVLFLPTVRQHRFTKLLEVLAFLKDVGLTPMLAFGDSYRVTMDALMLDGSGYSVSREDFLTMFEALLDTAIRHWGSRWVSTWRFEFHMPEKLYGRTDLEGFLSLFAACTALLREKLPQARIGGPAMAMDAEHLPRWRAWLQGVVRRNIPVDFVSLELWSDYTLKTGSFSGQFGELRETKTVESLQNADTALAVQKVHQVRSLMEAAGLEAKLYVSALGITKYQATAAQIGGHCAAYLVKCALAIQPLVDGIGCWKAVSREPEYPDEYSVFGSGCGLLSRHGLRNPNWYAYRFLSLLLPGRLYHGPHCDGTADGPERFCVLLHNCKDYAPYFCRNYLDGKTLAFRDPRLYKDDAALRQTLNITEVSPGTYQVRQYLIGDHHGCIAAVIQQMGLNGQPGKSEIAYLSGQSLPYQHTFRVAAEETLELTVTLQPNEVMLLMISREEDGAT